MNSRSITASADAKQFSVCSSKDTNAGLFHIRLMCSLLTDRVPAQQLMVRAARVSLATKVENASAVLIAGWATKKLKIVPFSSDGKDLASFAADGFMTRSF